MGTPPKALSQTGVSPLALYIENLHQSIELILLNDPGEFEAYEEAVDDRLDLLEEVANSGPEPAFVKAEILLHNAFVHLKFGHELESAWLIRQSLRLVKKKKEAFPDYLPMQKTWGFLQVIMGSVPEEYHWLLSVLGMKGSIDLGLNALMKHTSSNDPLSPESEALLQLVHVYLLDQPYLDIHTDNKDLPPLKLFIKLLADTKKGHGEEAIEAYELLKANGWSYPVTYYLGGEAYLRKGDYSKAIEHYEYFIENARGSANLKDAHYKIFLAYHLSGSVKQANVYHSLAKEKGTTQTEADKHANRSLKKELWPHARIMQLRLLTDGGYYSKADSLLQAMENSQFTHEENELEYMYRKARLAHKQNRLDKAITLYQQVIESKINTSSYYAPNSCLQLGLIYAGNKELEKAKAYLKKVSTYPRHEYKRSLDQKAKNALAKL